MKENSGKESRILLQSSYFKFKQTYFVPWYYDPFTIKWVGVSRWKGNNNRTLTFATKDGNRTAWKVCGSIPILPKGHPLRKMLEMKSTLMKHKINLRRI